MSSKLKTVFWIILLTPLSIIGQNKAVKFQCPVKYNPSYREGTAKVDKNTFEDFVINLCRKGKLEYNFDLIPSTNLRYFQAIKEGNDFAMYYNPNDAYAFMQSNPLDIAGLYAFMHAVVHSNKNHETNSLQTDRMELEADELAGKAIAIIVNDYIAKGAMTENDKNNVWQKIETIINASVVLPTKGEKIAAVKKGYVNAGGYIPPIELTISETPKPTTTSISTPINATFSEPQMVFVEGSEFTRGCTSEQGTDCGSAEKPAHKVSLNNFSIGKYEVTVGQYLVFCKETGDHYPKWLETGDDFHVENGSNKHYKDLGYRRNGTENLPIVGVSWNDAVAYCKWLSGKTNKAYRLPTEAEWEFAARGGKKSNTYKYSGSNTIGDVAWYSENSGSKSHTVGQKQANELGIYDMSGNVWEWCSDWHDGNYYKNSPAQNPKGASNGTYRSMRGGSWRDVGSVYRVSIRGAGDLYVRSSDLGFRVVLVSQDK